MDTQHTPGPWWEDDDGCVASGKGDDYVTVAQVLTGDADRALIAAAPDLLAAAEAMLVGKPSRFDVERLRAAVAVAREVKR